MKRVIPLYNDFDGVVYSIDFDKLSHYLSDNNLKNINIEKYDARFERNDDGTQWQLSFYRNDDNEREFVYNFNIITMNDIINDCYVKPHDHKEVAHKFDNNKSRIDLIPPKALMEIGDVFNYGAKKYEPYNWALGKGLEWHRLYAAIQRHLNSFWDGEDIDESGFTHLSHAACSLLMLMDLYYHNHGIDDRYKYYNNDNDDSNVDNDFPDTKFLAVIESNKKYNLFERVLQDYKYSNTLTILSEVFGFPSYNKFRVKSITIIDIYSVDTYNNSNSKEYILPETICGTYSFKYVVNDDIIIIVSIDNRYNLTFEYKTDIDLDHLCMKIQYTFAMR